MGVQLMKAQQPAEGISLRHDFGDAKYYRVDCTCGNEDDSIEVCIEIEEDMQEILVMFDTIHQTNWWKRVVDWDTYKIDNSWLYAIINSLQELINGVSHRLQVTKDVWLHGYVKYRTTTYMTKQQALNFAQLLRTGIKDIEDFQSTKGVKK